MNAIVKPSLPTVSVSLAGAIFLGVGGLYLYLSTVCFGGGRDCAAYSPARIFVAYVLSAPIFLMQKAFFGTVGDVTNFDPIVFRKFGWLAPWGYYYVLTSVVAYLVRSRRNKALSQSD